jgi:nucleoside-diphosphate-sugar epimerase
VVNQLHQRNLPYRAIARKQYDPNIQLTPANLLNEKECLSAIRGSSHVFFCVGLPYNYRIWRNQWPKLMKNVVAACEDQDAALIFLDNIYMYGPPPLKVPFDESHPQDCTSQKGAIRKEIADYMNRAIRDERIRGVIGRAADFYGPYAVNSMIYLSLIKPMLVGKKGNTLSPLDVPHTYAYTEDLGKALVELGLNEDTYGQVWHLPVNRAITFKELTGQINELLQSNLPVSMMPKGLQKLISLFVPPLREAMEMNYQFESVYDMSWDKFRKRFPDFKVTDYVEGLKATMASFKS